MSRRGQSVLAQYAPGGVRKQQINERGESQFPCHCVLQSLGPGSDALTREDSNRPYARIVWS